jgi:hypothetical protein
MRRVTADRGESTYPRRPRVPVRLSARLLAVVAVAELAAASFAAAGTTAHHGGVAGNAPAGIAGARARPPVHASTPDGRMAGVRRLLERRAAALLHRDRAAFVATADPRQRSLRTAQRRLFDDLRAVPLATWSYAVARVPAAPLPAGRRRALGGSAWLADVTLRYSFRGYASAATVDRLYLTFVRRGDRWYLGGDGDGAAAGLTGARELWDYGPVAVVSGARSLVLGHPEVTAELRAVAAEADRDVPRVAAFWGRRGWADRVVVVVPAGHRELEGLVGGLDLTQIAAVTTVETDQRVGAGRASGPSRGTGAAGRIIVNPTNFDDLGALGRRVVLTHEITHVATGRVTGASMPDWLIEGFADYVGFRGTGVPVPVAGRELAVRVAAGWLPSRLPADSAFAGGNRQLAAVYEEAWLACRYVATRWGERALVALYRTVGANGRHGRPDAVDDGIAGVLHTSAAGFVAGWRNFLRTVLR